MVSGTDIAKPQPTDMKPIMMVYPGFQALPKGLKQLLVESESFFFEEETTFIRRNRKPAASLGVDNDRPAGGQQLPQSWNN